MYAGMIGSRGYRGFRLGARLARVLIGIGKERMDIRVLHIESSGQALVVLSGENDEERDQLASFGVLTLHGSGSDGQNTWSHRVLVQTARV